MSLKQTSVSAAPGNQSSTAGQVQTVMQEDRLFPPPAEFAAKARIGSLAAYEAMWKEAAGDIEKFWGKLAGELHWFSPFSKVLEWNEPFAKWFVGGKTNASYNCLDVHLNSPERNKAALIWEGEPGEERTLTYQQLHHQVCKFANVLKRLGMKQGDVASIYMPQVPELVIAMLACARIGVIHSVIFGGFSSEAIADRNNDAGAKLVITADGGWRRGQQLQLKATVDAALAKSPTVKHCIVLHRMGLPVEMHEGRDHWWHELMSGTSAHCPAEPLDSEAPLFILYTSGSTGKPKGIKHTTAGYTLFAKKTFEWVFDYRDDDLFWCTADCGWVTGHTYVVYGPLMAGATVLMYEGAPNWPDEGRFWQMIEKYRVTIFYTAPTAIRSFIKWGDAWVDQHDLSSLRLLGHGGRRNQSRGVDVVPPQNRPRALPHRRYLVANRDRRHHDEPACRGHRDQAGKLHQAAAGHYSGNRGCGRQTGQAGAGRLADDHQAVAGHAAWHLGRRCPVQRAILVESAAPSIWQATTRAATATATTGLWGGLTTC